MKLCRDLNHYPVLSIMFCPRSCDGFIVIAISRPDGPPMTKRWRNFFFWNSVYLFSVCVWSIDTIHKKMTVEFKVKINSFFHKWRHLILFEFNHHCLTICLTRLKDKNVTKEEEESTVTGRHLFIKQMQTMISKNQLQPKSFDWNAIRTYIFWTI